MQYTDKYRLQKPDPEDFILIGDLNINMDILEGVLKEIEADIGDLEQGLSIGDLLKKKADLGADGKVLPSQLPLMEDNILFYPTVGNFPATGNGKKVYVATSPGTIHRWTGTTYVELSRGVVLGETSATAYRGDRGKAAYDHSLSPHLSLGTASSMAYRGDHGKIAYDHSQSPHAPVDVYTKAEVDNLLAQQKMDYEAKIAALKAQTTEHIRLVKEEMASDVYALILGLS